MTVELTFLNGRMLALRHGAHLVQPPAQRRPNQTRFLRALSCQAWISPAMESPQTLWDCVPVLDHLLSRKLFLTLRWNFLSSSMHLLLPLVLLPWASEKSLAPSSLPTPTICRQQSLLKAKQAQFSQPRLMTAFPIAVRERLWFCGMAFFF